MFWGDRIANYFFYIKNFSNYYGAINFEVAKRKQKFMLHLLEEILWVWESWFFILIYRSVFLCDLDSTGVDAGSSIIFFNNKAATV